MSFSKSLQAARDARGLTQAELAKRAQVAVSTINYAEGSVRGGSKQHTLRFETLKRILQSLELTPDSEAFRKLALEWFSENLRTPLRLEDEQQLVESAKKPAAWQVELQQLQTELTDTKNAKKIELLRWAAGNERALSVLKILKHFEDKTAD